MVWNLGQRKSLSAEDDKLEVSHSLGSLPGSILPGTLARLEQA